VILHDHARESPALRVRHHLRVVGDAREEVGRRVHVQVVGAVDVDHGDLNPEG
jgi:hypothetical protein